MSDFWGNQSENSGGLGSGTHWLLMKMVWVGSRCLDPIHSGLNQYIYIYIYIFIDIHMRCPPQEIYLVDAFLCFEESPSLSLTIDSWISPGRLLGGAKAFLRTKKQKPGLRNQKTGKTLMMIAVIKEATNRTHKIQQIKIQKSKDQKLQSFLHSLIAVVGKYLFFLRFGGD